MHEDIGRLHEGKSSPAIQKNHNLISQDKSIEQTYAQGDFDLQERRIHYSRISVALSKVNNLSAIYKRFVGN